MNNNLTYSFLGRYRKELQTILPASVSGISTALECLKQKALSTAVWFNRAAAVLVHTNMVNVSKTKCRRSLSVRVTDFGSCDSTVPT